jgi:hypothetical protein
MTRHRDDQERARVVRAWRRSGCSAHVFAAQQGISGTTLFNWARDIDGTSKAERADAGVELVEVVPVDVPEAAVEGWTWEVETRGGVVRGRGELGAEAIGAIVDALGKVRR